MMSDTGQSTSADEHDARQLKIREIKELMRKLSQFKDDREKLSQRHEAELATIRQRQEAELQAFHDGIIQISDHPAFEYFGICPACLKSDGSVNIRSEHWYHCAEHRVKWCVGANLFSHWKDEDDEIWQKNFELIKDFTEIRPLNPEYDAEAFDRATAVSADVALADAMANAASAAAGI
jgi:hypothetical protein